MSDKAVGRWTRIGEAWAEGLTDLFVIAGEHIPLVAALLLFAALEWVRHAAPVHLGGASAAIADLVLIVAEATALLTGIAPRAIRLAVDIGVAAGHGWHRIRDAWRS